MEVLIGNPSQKLKMALSTNQSTIAVHSDKGIVPNGYNSMHSSTFESSDLPPLKVHQDSYVEGRSTGKSKDFTENFGFEDFRLRMNGFNRETVLPSLEFGMLIQDDSTATQASKFDGFVGIAPYDMNDEIKPIYNFMYQL
jgi:hypothetical protein